MNSPDSFKPREANDARSEAFKSKVDLLSPELREKVVGMVRNIGEV